MVKLIVQLLCHFSLCFLGVLLQTFKTASNGLTTKQKLTRSHTITEQLSYWHHILACA